MNFRDATANWERWLGRRAQIAVGSGTRSPQELFVAILEVFVRVPGHSSILRI